ncbi:MAG: DMT family transporter [Actinomycetota bacterium]|nr:DMT family transporter [Actinomycetota bacterium]
MSQRMQAYVGLVVAAFLFGATFVVVKEAVVAMPPLAFVGWRFLLGAAVLFLFARPHGRSIWIDGLMAGILLFIGFASQTAGLTSTTASNSGLITGLYVVFTPLLAAAVRRRAPAVSTVFGAFLSVIGLGFLTITAGFGLNSGDILTIVFGLASSSLFEGFPLPSPSVLPALIGTGVIVAAGAFLLQVRAQTVIGPSRTAIVLSAEPLFAAATAAVVLGERLTLQGWFGAAMIMIGMYVVLAFSPAEHADLVAAEALSEVH